jgi:hypothetical protein
VPAEAKAVLAWLVPVWPVLMAVGAARAERRASVWAA